MEQCTSRLAPNAGIGNVAERRKIDVRNKLASRPGQDYDLVRSILRDAVKRIDKLGVILCSESERFAVAVEFGD